MANSRPPHGQRPKPPGRGSGPGGPGRKPGPRRAENRPAPARPERRPGPERAGAVGGPERLQKVLASAGLGSRRACEELITQGRVTVDGQVVRELGTRVDPSQARIALDGEPIRLERHVYFAVNKPKGYVSTNNDPAGKPKVVDLLPQIPQRVYTVGRLDEQSTGLLILTNDGELANKLAHPKFGVEKVYRVVVAGTPDRSILDKLVEGIWLAEGKVRAKRVRPVAKRGESTVLEMTLAEGKNREIRRMLARLGHKVMSLTRVSVGPVALKGLPVGEYRALTSFEVDMLRKVAAGMVVPSPRDADRRPRVPRGGNAPADRRADAPRPSEGPAVRPSLRPPTGQHPAHGGRPRPDQRGGAGSRSHDAPDARPARGPRPQGPGPGPQGPGPRAQGPGPRPVGPGPGPRAQGPGPRPAGPGPGPRAQGPGPRPPGPGPGPRVQGSGPRPAGPGPRPVEGGGPRPPRRPASPPPPSGPRLARTPPPPPAPPAPATPRSRRPEPPRPEGGRRIIIGLDPGASIGSEDASAFGPRRKRPVPKRSPRSSFGLKRKPKDGPADDNGGDA